MQNHTKNPCVYMLASKKNGTLYIGVTSNLIQRVFQHKNNITQGFTQKYNVKTLVWYEQHPSMESAIIREKRLKEWKRAWKIKLIEEMNVNWLDLYPSILGVDSSLRWNDDVNHNPDPSSRHTDSSSRHTDESRYPSCEGGVDSDLRRNDVKAKHKEKYFVPTISEGA
jgi:putative endonuclease